MMKSSDRRMSPRLFALALLGACSLNMASTAFGDGYSDTVLALHPDAYWRLNEAPAEGDPPAVGVDEAGEHLLKLSGDANQKGTGPRPDGGFAGFAPDNFAYDFTGVAEGATTNDNPYVPARGTEPRTIVAWVNLDSTIAEHTNNEGRIGILDYGTIVQGGQSNFTGFKFFVSRYVDLETGQPTDDNVFALNIHAREVRGDTLIVPGEWYMLAAVYPGAASLAAADFNSDGAVDGSDFLIWQQNLDPLSTTSSRENGDANGDNAVDAADLEIWKETFGQTSAGGGGTGQLGETRLYVNGVLQTLTGDTGVIPNTGLSPTNPEAVALPFRIGHDYGGWGIDGQVDEVSVWTSALAEEDILNLWNVAKNGVPGVAGSATVPEPTGIALLGMAMLALKPAASRLKRRGESPHA